MDGVQQLDARLVRATAQFSCLAHCTDAIHWHAFAQEDVEENVTMLDIEAALQEATAEAMGDATHQGQDLESFQSSLL